MRNKALTAAVAAVMAVSTLGVANAAEAQSRAAGLRIPGLLRKLKRA